MRAEGSMGVCSKTRESERAREREGERARESERASHLNLGRAWMKKVRRRRSMQLRHRGICIRDLTEYVCATHTERERETHIRAPRR